MKLQIKSEFVTPNSDVKDDDIITFVDSGKWNTLPQDPDKEVLQFTVKLQDDSIKKMTVNKTSQRILLQAWGEETENWKGKQAKASVVKQNVMGEIRFVIYLNPAEKEGQDNIVNNILEENPFDNM